MVHQPVSKKSLHELLEEREERIMTENSDKRVREAKNRLRYFIIFTDMNDQTERQRLLSYYAHRVATFWTIVNEAVKDKRRMTADMSLAAERKKHQDTSVKTRQDR